MKHKIFLKKEFNPKIFYVNIKDKNNAEEPFSKESVAKFIFLIFIGRIKKKKLRI